MITERRQEGVYVKDIAAELGVHPKTVSRALQRGGEPPRRPRRRASKLDPYKDQVDALLKDNIWNAEVIFRRLRQAGYRGGRSILRAYIQPKRRLRVRGGGTVRYETAPGAQMQHDWGERWLEIGGQRCKVYLAVNTLGFSRELHVVGLPRCDAEHTYEAVIQAFEAFEGVPATVLVDNQKSAVLDWIDGRPRFNPRFRALGRDYGFVPKACRPKRAQTKGKVERMVGYVAGSALAGAPAFDSWADLNAHLRTWCAEVANQRFLRELGEAVPARFEREREHLGPLPRARFDTAYHATRQVSLDAYVSVDGVRYSVPGHLVSERLAVRVQLDGWIELRDLAGTVVARHRAAPDGQRLVTIAEHHAALWQQVRVEARELGYYAEAG